MANTNFCRAKLAKNDEFYTQLADIEKELQHYRKHFKDKAVLCNCDNPAWSAFWKYFHLNFSALHLRKLISTYYDKTEPVYKTEYMGGNDSNIEAGIRTPLNGNGDFRNQECIELLQEADIVVTNSPFSLFRAYVDCLEQHSKKFLIIGNKNNVNDKNVFPLFRDNKLWFGYCSPSEFDTPTGTVNCSHPKGYELVTVPVKKMQGLCRWFTNLDITKRHKKLILQKTYSESEYPKYANYNAIEVKKVADIPYDYYGNMGVPITFFDSYNPEQFEIIGLADGNLGRGIGIGQDEETFQKYYTMYKALRRGKVFYLTDSGYPKIPYSRLIIRRKKDN